MKKVCQVTIVHKEKVNVIKKKLDQKDFSNWVKSKILEEVSKSHG